MSNLKPLTPKQEDRRHRILTATREMVADHGYDGMVMSQVADRAGVSPTTLYNLYNTKDELLLEALRDMVVENYQKLGVEAHGPGWKYLVRVGQNGAWLRRSVPAYGEAITNALIRATPNDALVELLMRTVRADFRNSLAAMRDRDELLDSVNIDHVATLMMGNYWSTFILLNKGVEKSAQLAISIVTNILSLLIASSKGSARVEMEAFLATIRQTGISDE